MRWRAFIGPSKGDAPDCIVVDLDLAGLDGLEICRQLAREESTRGLPVVVWGAATTAQAGPLARRAGAFAYVDRSEPGRAAGQRAVRAPGPAPDQDAEGGVRRCDRRRDGPDRGGHRRAAQTEPAITSAPPARLIASGPLAEHAEQRGEDDLEIRERRRTPGGQGDESVGQAHLADLRREPDSDQPEPVDRRGSQTKSRATKGSEAGMLTSGK